MKRLTLNISEDKLKQLEYHAIREGITTEQLLTKKIDSWLEESEDDFSPVANYVIEKNKELYKRLA